MSVVVFIENSTREYDYTPVCGVCKRSLRRRFGLGIIKLTDDECVSDKSLALLSVFPFKVIVLS